MANTDEDRSLHEAVTTLVDDTSQLRRRVEILEREDTKITRFDSRIELQELGASPAALADYVQVYARAANQLFARTSDGAEHDLLSGGSGGSAIYPTRATLFADEFITTVGGARELDLDTASLYNFVAQQTTPADGDAFSTSFMLKEGNYTLFFIGASGPNRGLLDWEIDGTLVIVGQDWYAGSHTRNVIQSASVTVSGSGRHTLAGTINGKNASSSSYYHTLTKVWFEPASDTTET